MMRFNIKMNQNVVICILKLIKDSHRSTTPFSELLVFDNALVIFVIFSVFF